MKISLIFLSLFFCQILDAQTDTTKSKQQASSGLASEARDPTGSILAFTIRFDDVFADHGGVEVKKYNLILQPIIPFKTWKLPHIMRITMPFIGSNSIFSAPNPDSVGNGIGDLVIVDVMLGKLKNGRWGLGPVVGVPTASPKSLGSGNWLLGPAAVIIAKSGKFQYGGLAQGFFSVSHPSDRKKVNVIALQPFFSYSLPKNWGIGLSEVSFNYDLELNTWVVLPIGVNVDKLVKIGKQPFRLFVQVESNLSDYVPSARWTFRLGITPLFVLSKNK